MEDEGLYELVSHRLDAFSIASRGLPEVDLPRPSPTEERIKEIENDGIK